LAKANNELENRDGKGGRPLLETRLNRNFKNLEGKRTHLEAAYDDRLKEFHKGRFLPGPLCPIGDYWAAAKDHLPERGHEPVAHYDGQGLGLPYIIATKTWAVVHEPGSTELNMGMFTKEAGATGHSDSSFRHCIPDSLAAFKITLSTARAVFQLVHPWNLSITVLHLFLENHQYGYKFFSNAKDHVRQLVSFCDGILLSNAKHWQLGKPCLDAKDLAQMWVLFTSNHSADTCPQEEKCATNSKETKKRDRSPAKSWKRDFPALKEGAPCGKFNNGTCRNDKDRCYVRGFKLRHRCSFVKKDGEFCEKKHTKADHKQ